MMKFFRKHNKKLLAVFMVLLMIVFLGGSALDTMLRPSFDRVVAESHVGPISYADHSIADAMTSILDRVGLNWRTPLPGVAVPLETIDWILLTREAEKLGMTDNLSTVRSTMASQSAIDNLARRIRKRPDDILHAMARYSSIQRAAIAIGGATAPSEAEVLAAARDAFEKVRVNAVLIPARAFVNEDAQFTEDEIDAQFTTYRDREPGTGTNFGYYVAPMVNVQYVRIDRDKIAEQIGVADLERKARRYFDEQRERDRAFLVPPEEATPDIEADEELLEGPPYEKSPYLEWDEAREIAIGIVRKQEADQTASRVANWLLERAADPWLSVETGKDGYKVAPETVKRQDHYGNILEKAPRTIAYSEAFSTGMTDFFSEDEADDVAEIGQATFRPERGVWQRFKALAFRTKAIVPVITDENSASRSDYLAPFQTCRYPLTNPDGNVYVFRVFDVRAGHVPESVDEVRERVLTDLRLLEGYETAKARAESLRSCSGDALSLQEAYDSDDELVSLKDTERGAGIGYFEPPPFARASRYEAVRRGLGRSFGPGATYVGGGVGLLPTAVVEQCFALEGADEYISVIELKGRATIMLVEWLERQPIRVDEFAELRESFVQEMSSARAQTAVADWFNPQQVRARNGFQLVTN